MINSLKLTGILKKSFFFFLFVIFMLNLNDQFRDTEILSNLFYFLTDQIWVLRANSFVCCFWLPLGSGSVDPHIFADPDTDPGSQNVADPTDLDPKHCFYNLILFIIKEENPCRMVYQNPPEHWKAPTEFPKRRRLKMLWLPRTHQPASWVQRLHKLSSLNRNIFYPLYQHYWTEAYLVGVYMG